MKHVTVIAFILLLLWRFDLASQCPPYITFFSQTEIDDFPINYPNCTDIEGEVFICGDDITNLKGLDAITSIGGSMAIMLCDSLTSLSGLENLAFIGGETDWGMNNSLESLDGLQNLTYIGGTLYIHENPQLTSISALENLTIVNGHIFLTHNTSLTTLSGIDYVDSDSIAGLGLRSNSILSTCNVESICNYLANPNGSVEIEHNGQGCGSIQQVEEACTVGVPEQEIDPQVLAYPNPFTSSTTIEYELTESSHVQLTIYNTIGEAIYRADEGIKQQGKHTFSWTPESLPEGIYYGVLRSEEGVSVVKMVKQ